jgi:amino acid adenylation domain-containing protein
MNRNIVDIYLLSPMQEGILFHTLYERGAGLYLVQLNCVLNGELNGAAFKQACQAVMQRHSGLRISFEWEGLEKPYQIVHREVNLPWDERDWRNLSESQQALQLRRFLEEDRSQEFDLTQPPLMRFALFQRSDATWYFTWTCHHLLGDGWSVSLLANEVLVGYEGLCRGQAVSLPPARSYSHFIAWLKKQDMGAAERYWRATLCGFDHPTPFGEDLVESVSDAATFGELKRTVSSDATRKLRAFAREFHLTVNTIVQGAWAIVLSRYAERDDLVFGVVVSGRPAELPGVETIVGPFINTLPVRVKLDPAAKVGSWLAQLQHDQMEMRKYEYSPLTEVQRWSELPRGTPLFNSTLIFQSQSMQSEGSGSRRLRIDGDRVEERPDGRLVLIVSTSGDLVLQFKFDCRYFSAKMLAPLVGHLENVLNNLVTDPSRPLATVDIFDASERERMLRGSDNARRSCGSGRCMHHRFADRAQRSPDVVAIVCENLQMNYGELNVRADRFARRLRKMGVGPEVCVAICMKRSLEMVVGLLGILKAGGAYVPLDLAYPKDRLSFILQDSGAALLVTQDSLVRDVPELAGTDADPRVICLDIESAFDPETGTDSETVTAESDARSLAYILYTSGSTGLPKGVQISHSALENFLDSMQETPGFCASDVLLAVTTLCFDIAGLELWLPLITGGTVVIASAEVCRDAKSLAGLLAHSGATVMQATPATWRMLLDCGWEGNPGLKILCGGEAWGKNLAEALLLRSESVWNMYGPTETTVWSGVTQVKTPGAPPLGWPIGNTKFYVLDRHLRPVPAGCCGELHISGSGLARGYRNRSDLTAEKFVPNPFSSEPGGRLYKTGDSVRYGFEGELHFVGRKDSQVKIRGFRVELAEIEAALKSHEKVREGVVLVREGDSGEKHLVAYTVSQPGARVSPEQLRMHLKQRLPVYMVPATFVELEKLPLTPNGKIDRKALPVPERRRANEGYEMPRTPAEEVLVEIWAKVLGLDRVGIHDNFFEIGGNSIHSIRIVALAREAGFLLDDRIRTLFENPTVAALAEKAQSMHQGSSGLDVPEITPALRRSEYPLSFAQERLWYIDQMEPGTAAYNVPRILKLRGAFNLEAFTRAVEEVMRRHDSLRTGFQFKETGPVQIIRPVAMKVLHVFDFMDVGPDIREIEIQALFSRETLRRFDLAEPPLLRVQIILVAPEETRVLIVMHHIIADGWSMGILIGEFSHYYSCFDAGLSPALPEPRLQYVDFALWQRTWLHGEIFQRFLNFWQQQLQPAPARLSLPYKKEGPASRSDTAGNCSFVFLDDEKTALQSMCRQYGTSLYMVLLAGFKVLLSFYTGQRDILVGTRVANRNHGGTEQMVGFFVNTILLRSRIADDQTFEQFLKGLREELLSAYFYQDLPFERLMHHLNPQRNSQGINLQVLLTMDNIPALPMTLPGLELESLPVPDAPARVELALSFSENGTALTGRLEFRKDLFEPAIIEKMAGSFQSILKSAVQNPRMTIAKLIEETGRAAEARQAAERKNFRRLNQKGLETSSRRPLVGSPNNV